MHVYSWNAKSQGTGCLSAKGRYAIYAICDIARSVASEKVLSRARARVASEPRSVYRRSKIEFPNANCKLHVARASVISPNRFFPPFSLLFTLRIFRSAISRILLSILLFRIKLRGLRGNFLTHDDRRYLLSKYRSFPPETSRTDSPLKPRAIVYTCNFLAAQFNIQHRV